MSAPGPIILTNNNPQLIRPYCTNQSLQFYWTAPVSEGSSEITGYSLRQISPNEIDIVLGPTTFSTRVTGLTNGVEYSYEIAAFNAIDKGPYSQFRIVQPGNKPGPVKSLSATLNFTTVTLTWTAPGSDGEATVKWYVIKGYDTSTGNLVYNNSLNGYTTQKTYYNISNPYVFHVYAVNDPGYSPSTSITVYPSLITLRASSYSISDPPPPVAAPWMNESLNPSVPSATLAVGNVSKSADQKGIALDGSSYWTFPNIALGPFWSVVVWYKNVGTPIGGDPEGVGASIVTQETVGGGVNVSVNVALGYSVNNAVPTISGPIVGSFLTAGNWTTGTETVLAENTWTNIVVTNGGGQMRTYVNGAFSDFTASGDSTDYGTPYRIGARWDDPNVGLPACLRGAIGEVSIYKYVLTPAAILQFYNDTQGTYA